MHKYKIGLEVHVQLNTKYKLFSGALNMFNNDANVNLDLFDIALPGTYPRINSEAITKAYILAKMLKTNIADMLVFDRKHYYYPDLPSGYQITQYEKPIGINGSYNLSNNKSINIRDVHIECDAGKLKRYGNKLHIDYNRCIVPLAEIVTDCTFENYEDVVEFLYLLINDLKINNISSAKLEHGNLRVDVNISRIINIQNNITTCRFEIKNVNSFKAIKRVIKIAKNKLIDCTENDHDMTFNYDDNNIIPSREKCGAAQYMYLYEYTLYPVKIDLFIPKELHIEYTLDKVHEICKNFENIDENIILIFICDINLKLILNFILNSKYCKKFFTSAIYFILENRNLFNEFGDNVFKVSDLLQEGCDILFKKQATKVNLNNIIRNILEENLFCTAYDLLLKNNLIIKDIDVDYKKIYDLICLHFKTIENFKNSNMRALNFMIGVIIKNTDYINPVIIKEILIKIQKD